MKKEVENVHSTKCSFFQPNKKNASPDDPNSRDGALPNKSQVLAKD
jgi:hypothetical protein